MSSRHCLSLRSQPRPVSGSRLQLCLQLADQLCVVV